MKGNFHARFWIGGGGSNPFADHTKARSFALLIHVSLEELVPQDHFYRHLDMRHISPNACTSSYPSLYCTQS